MGIRENKVETYLHDEVVKIEGTTRKWVSPGRAGVPDRIVFYKGGIAFVEVKTTSGRLSGAQIREHMRLKSHGIKVYTVHGHDEVDRFIKEVLLT